MCEFKDILEERRLQNDFAWITKSYRPKQAFHKNSNDINPMLFRYKVLIENSIHLLLQEAFPNGSKPDHFEKLNSILKEIGYTKNIVVVRWLGFVLIRIMKKVMQSIFITEGKLLKLKMNMGKHPVILLPTHRSYADFVLMAFLCFNYDIEIPVVVAGMDFYGMFGMATLLRQCGAMYMRRSFKEDKIYGAIFKKYVQTVIVNGNSPFEFFIEGTRSRCGKSLMPKLGLLKMIIELYVIGEVEDVSFVPITISYDRLMEDVLFAREVIGIPKPKESTSGLLKAISLLEEVYGNIYINVGNEISLKEFKKECDNKNNLLTVLAYTIVKSQQDNIVVTIFNILCLVIISQLMLENGNNIKISSLIKDIMELNRILTRFGAVVGVFDDIYNEIKRISRIHKFIGWNIKNDTIFINHIRNDGVCQNTFQNTLTIIMLQHYANPCYHFIVNPAIIVLILKIENTLEKNILFHKFKLFRSLFKHEFLLFEYFENQDFNNSCKHLQHLNIIKFSADRVSLVDEKIIDYFWWCSLIPYLQGYLFICECLIQVNHKIFNTLKLKQRIKKQLELAMDVRDDVCLCYAFSSDFTSCTFLSLIDIDILHLDRTNDNIRIVNVEKLKTITYFLKTILQQETVDNQELVDFVVSKL